MSTQTTPPGLLCCACDRRLYPRYARRTNDGWVHADGCGRVNRVPRPCEECGVVGRRSGPLCAACLGYTTNALDGGRWVLDPIRRVHVWEAA